MSSIHSLQRSTTSQKLLQSVQALRPFLRESLRKNGFDPFEYTNGDDEQYDTYLQTPHYEDSLTHSGNLGSEEYIDMSTYDQVHMIYEQDGGNELGNAQCHGPHGGHVDEGNDGGHTHQQYNHIGCGHNVIVHDEGNDLSGYVHDDYYMNDLVSHQYIGYEHKGSIPNSSAHMPESRTDNSDMLSSLHPSSHHLHGMHYLTSLGLSSQDDCRFPTEEHLQPTLHPHNLYSYTHLHSQHNYQKFQHYPQCQDIFDGMAASLYNIDLNSHETRWSSWYNDNAIKAASLPQSQQRKRRQANSLPDKNAKRTCSFDEISDAMEDDGGDNCSNPNAAKASGFSSNLVCERRRRRKINEALYTLRSVVPIVSKMDKASIMSDALTYAYQLRKRVDDLQNDILELQVGKHDDVDHTSIDELVQKDSSGSTSNPNKDMDFEKYFQSLPKHKILELNVFNIQRNTYHLRICCKKGPGDLLQLTRVIEALNFDILNSTVASVGDQSTINTVVVKVDADEVLKPEEVKEMILDTVSKYGLHV